MASLVFFTRATGSCCVVGALTLAGIACNGETLFSAGPVTGSGGAGGSTTTTAVGGTSNVGGSPTSVGGTGGTGGAPNGGAGGGVGGGPCEPGPNDDYDGDGYSVAQGDCNDCEPLVSPNNIEIVGNGLDENCDGSLDDTLAACDQNIDLDEADPVTALRAIELCKISSGPRDWGVVSASWVLADGSQPPVDPTLIAAFHLGHGVLDDFGPNVAPRGGAQMLALSNDHARRPGDPDAGGVVNKNYNSPLPTGFPKDSTTCDVMTQPPANDAVAVEVVVRTPSNATGFSFDFDMYAADYPNFICSVFDDTFAALLSPVPMGLLDGNITFNAAGDPFSVNGAEYQVCACMDGPPCMAGNKTFPCTLGAGQLEGTGFELTAAATGWQVTTAPATGGSEITVRFAIWDVTDSTVTTTALIDHWQWLTDAGVIVETSFDP